MSAHSVAVLALDGVVALDVGIPATVLAPRPGLPYRLTMCGVRPEVATSSGFSLLVPGTLAQARRADTLIVPGYTSPVAALPDEVLDAIAHVHARGRRVVSICTGAFALAAAGVLDGRQATTHWSRADELAAGFPRVTVDRDVLYVDEGDVLTSAGVSAGIDLCLHIIRRDVGVRAANEVARGVVAPPHRDGGQSQFIPAPVSRDEGSSLAGVRAWALGRLDRPLSVRDLARQAGMSDRTFARRFVAETGRPPLQWLLQARVDLARDLLESGTLGIDEIATRTGLGTAINLRVHFRRQVGTTPTAYRRTFQSGPSLPPPSATLASTP